MTLVRQHLGRRLSTPRAQYTVLFFALVVTYAASASYTIQSVDTASAYYPAWQLAHHGNITLDAFADKPLWLVDVGDRIVSNRFPGATWIATPLYLLDRSNTPSAAMGNLAAAAATAGAITVLFAILRRLCGTRVALLGSLLVAFGTPAWTVSADALWTHGPGQLWLLAGVLLLTRRAYLLGGLAFGAAILTRPHYAIVPATMGLWNTFMHRGIRPLVMLGLGSGVGLGLLLLYNHMVFGTVTVGGYVYESLDPTAEGAGRYVERVLGTLLSPSRGVLLLTPFVLLLAPGLRPAWREAPVWVRSSAAAGTLYMLVQLYLNRWSGGYAFFSYRLAIEWLTLCAPLLALCYVNWTAQTLARRRAFFALAAYSTATHAAGAILYRGERSEPDYWTMWNVGEVFGDRPVAATAIAVSCGLVAWCTVRVTRPVIADVLPESPNRHQASR